MFDTVTWLCIYWNFLFIFTFSFFSTNFLCHFTHQNVDIYVVILDYYKNKFQITIIISSTGTLQMGFSLFQSYNWVTYIK